MESGATVSTTTVTQGRDVEGGARMGLVSINHTISSEHQERLMPGETAYHFAYIDTKGGCGSTETAKKWVLVSNLRVMYEAAVKEGEGQTARYVRTSGSIPVSKISFIGTSSVNSTEGCNTTTVHLLK